MSIMFFPYYMEINKFDGIYMLGNWCENVIVTVHFFFNVRILNKIS
jgi:hypothetical protein